jgi:hypothetical protein
MPILMAVGHRTHAEDFCSFEHPISGPPYEVANRSSVGPFRASRCLCVSASTDGHESVGALVQAADGNFYGITALAGVNCDQRLRQSCDAE